jgi:aspartyl-tRNA(Asn)/glutamyl-tRNA(Gln) amidotransferase subunit A
MQPPFPSIHELHRQFQSGALTPNDLLQQCLTMIDRRDAELHAWVRVDRSGAQQLAAEQTTWLTGEGRGQPLPPLFGIPLGIKDIIDVAGWPTLAGSQTRAGHCARSDAAVVARLRAAGAILLGKTVTTEFACFDPATTRNPWNLAHTPGGSSSGSAAAVAAGMCVAALGSQTGGSILRPAAFCGIVGFKPSFDLVPTTGVVPVAAALDHVGPLTTCVADACLMFEAMSGAHLTSVPLPPTPRLVTIASFFQEKGLAEPTAIVLKSMEQLGAIATREPPVPIADMHTVHRAIMAKECAEHHRQAVLYERALLSPGVVSLVEEGLRMTMPEYAQAQARAKQMRIAWREWFQTSDAILIPTTAGAAPATLQTTGDPRWQSPWSLLGWPAITIPCGLTSQGMPVGLQIIALSDAVVLALAERFATQVKFTHRPTFRHVSSLDVTL